MPEPQNPPFELFALGSSQGLGEHIARRLGISLGAIREERFDDGEFKIGPGVPVAGRRAVVLQSLYSDQRASVSDRLCRLLVFAGALRDAGAEHVVALVPYLAFSRQDRRTKFGEPVSSRYLAALLQSVGVDGIATVDVHNVAGFENAFACRKWLATAAPLLVAHLIPRLAERERVLVLSPDAGGMKRARTFARLLAESLPGQVDLGVMEKRRGGDTTHPATFAGEAEGAAVVVVDDVISGGTTLAQAAEACRQRGAREIHGAVTHGLFAPGSGQRLADAGLHSLTVTNSIADPARRCPELGERLEVVDCAPLFLEVLEQP
jgi:ribose-phosphate pyrophosphokinase